MATKRNGFGCLGLPDGDIAGATQPALSQPARTARALSAPRRLAATTHTRTSTAHAHVHDASPPRPPLSRAPGLSFSATDVHTHRTPATPAPHLWTSATPTALPCTSFVHVTRMTQPTSLRSAATIPSRSFRSYVSCPPFLSPSHPHLCPGRVVLQDDCQLPHWVSCHRRRLVIPRQLSLLHRRLVNRVRFPLSPSAARAHLGAD